MSDDSSSRRRQFLQSAGVGGSVLLAGCADRLGLQDDSGGDGDGNREAGVIAAVDQEAIRQAQADIQQEVESGNITQEEAQTQLQQRQQEIVGNSVDSLAETLKSELSLSVDQKYPELGGLVVSGSAGSVLDALGLENVRGLISASQFEEAQ